MGAIEDPRKLVQDFIAPELREVGAKLQALAELQKTMRDDLLTGQKDMELRLKTTRDDLLNSQKDLELRLLREIVKSEERLTLLLKVAQLSNENAELTKRLEEKKNPASPAQ